MHPRPLLSIDPSWRTVEASMRAYATLMQQEKVLVPSVQAALDALRDKGLVWRAAYGDYALEDESLASWDKT